MTEFVIILEDGTLYKDVFIKVGKKFAESNSDIYWYLREHSSIEIFNIENITFSDMKKKNLLETIKPEKISKNEIYYFTTSKKYQH